MEIQNLALRGPVPPHAKAVCTEALAGVPKLGWLPKRGDPPWSCADGCAQALSSRQALPHGGNKPKLGMSIKPTGKMIRLRGVLLSLR